LIAGQLAARLLVNELAETVVETALPVLDAGLEQFIGQAERGEFAHGMRQQCNAYAKFFEFRRALVDAAGNAAFLEVECERQSADAAADDGDFHRA
jgi:hypothetical protein